LENNYRIRFVRVVFATLIFFIAYPINAKEFFDKALWIVRDHITSKRLIDEVIQFAENNNYNVLFVQIRGRGDAYYSSKLVPRTHLLKSNEFDPLQYILKKVKNKNIKIHAWMNVYYLWSSSQKPFQNDHLLLNHPEWLDNNTPDFIDVENILKLTKRNKKANGEGFYLAPTHPEVDAHLQNVVTELLQNYQLDGIHFDYIRYHMFGWGMNPIGLKSFLNHSSTMPGLPSLSLQNKPKFSDFKKSAISKFLEKSSIRIRAYQPNCMISAAVKPNLKSAHKNFGQEWDLWLDKGYIDRAVPMNYTRDNKLFKENILSIKKGLDSKLIENVIMGIGIYNQNYKSAGQKIIEAKKNKFGGVSIFSYTVFKTDPEYSKKLNKYID
tara:strand:+ start:160 stop:1302 length:1143 start_codon:yes stop_codon:yes gene_type:complete